MPQQTVYIRNDDMPLWKALPNKAAFISENLHKQANTVRFSGPTGLPQAVDYLQQELREWRQNLPGHRVEIQNGEVVAWNQAKKYWQPVNTIEF